MPLIQHLTSSSRALSLDPHAMPPVRCPAHARQLPLPSPHALPPAPPRSTQRTARRGRRAPAPSLEDSPGTPHSTRHRRGAWACCCCELLWLSRLLPCCEMGARASTVWVLAARWRLGLKELPAAAGWKEWERGLPPGLHRCIWREQRRCLVHCWLQRQLLPKDRCCCCCHCGCCCCCCCCSC